ncbi:MAG: acylphosphatase [Dehalococcoidales bacterium]|jgi:acylphosphatase|nr:acylphosphatase [Dehalococcoidales bacterium]MDP7286127.1 acylphosphatase [Dehalococcoidales bacterium]
MSELVSVQAIVCGDVQGVFFRAFVSEVAEGLNLTGYVCNLPSGNVEVRAEGEEQPLEKLISRLKVGPPAARVRQVITDWSEYTGEYAGFRIKY